MAAAAAVAAANKLSIPDDCDWMNASTRTTAFVRVRLGSSPFPRFDFVCPIN